jgi:hypothetical protein
MVRARVAGKNQTRLAPLRRQTSSYMTYLYIFFSACQTVWLTSISRLYYICDRRRTGSPSSLVWRHLTSYIYHYPSRSIIVCTNQGHLLRLQGIGSFGEHSRNNSAKVQQTLRLVQGTFLVCLILCSWFTLLHKCYIPAAAAASVCHFCSRVWCSWKSRGWHCTVTRSRRWARLSASALPATSTARFTGTTYIYIYVYC